MTVRLMRVIRVSPSWKAQKMIKVGGQHRVFHGKYKRFLKRKYGVQAHYDSQQVPRVNDWVYVRPVRPISARKRHVAWLKDR